MRRIVLHVLLFALGCLSGVALMWTGGGDEADPMEAEQEKSAPVRVPRPLVCARIAAAADPDAGDTGSIDACRLEAAVARAQLDACEEDRKRVRHAWEEDGPESERPETWTELVERSIDACDLPIELDIVECTEYPCVAGVRPSGVRDAAIPGELLAEQLQEAVTRCGPLREAFAVGEADDALQVHAIEIPCDEGGTGLTFGLIALDTHGAAWHAWENRGQDPEGALRWMMRRSDDLAAISQCDTR
jgi:hypothetical protein